MTRIVIASTIALGLLGTFAEAAEGDWRPEGHDTAAAACIDLNGYKPAKLVEAVEDGLGDWIVWVEDKDADLWLCNANAAGEVFANVLLNGDLLSGEGTELVSKGAEGEDRAGPAGSAEQLCAAVGGHMEDLEIVATVDDALGDYLVWLKNGDDAYWMCNASADAKLYAFERVEYPIDAVETDEAACCEPYADRRI